VTAVFPPPVTFNWEPVEKMPEETPEQRASKVAAIRLLFAEEVARERFRHSVWGHLIGLGFNAIVCSYMYFTLHLGTRALLNFVVGGALWEANIFTSPNEAMQLADALDVSPPDARQALRLKVVPVALGLTGAGVAVVGRF